MFIFGFAVMFPSVHLPAPFSWIFISSSKHTKKITTAKAILANWTVNPPASGVEWANESERKKNHQPPWCWTSFSAFRPRCSLWCWKKAARKKKQKNKLSHPLEGEGGAREFKKYRFCYDALSEWIIPHTGRMYEPRSSPTSPMHTSLFTFL